tara:strand:- start:82259 stop:85441 length:3183 start_codon:yes stop_codon:yes gene_type:complete
MANRWQHLNFFDKNGKYYDFDYDTASDIWTGEIYLPQVSTNLFEVAQIFVLEKLVHSNSGAFKYGFPHTLETTASGDCSWEVEWKTPDPDVFLLFQFDLDFVTGTDTSLDLTVDDGPTIKKYDKIDITLDYDSAQTVNNEGYVVTNNIRSEVLQINLAINAEDEDTYKRTLVIKDKCSNTVVAEFVIYGETVGEDERLKILTQNFGYNIISQDSLIFKETNIKEALPDLTEVNLKRKEIMLEGHNIYPFIGSYKGLINAIKFFGYSNLEIKEFWKNINKSSPRYGKYIQSNPISILSPVLNINDRSITLPNKNFKKTSLFSIIYKINKINPGKFTDEDLPITKEVFDYTIEEAIIKLFGLKRKLERDFLPLSAKIVDITGEADFFSLLELTNTISRNDRNTIVAGIDADFTFTPKGCRIIEDLRDLRYLSKLVIGDPSQNLVLGPYGSGEQIPVPPLGPDPNSVLGLPVDGNDFSVSDLAEYYLGYFSRFAPGIDTLKWIDGKTSKRLPDKPGITAGAPIVLQNASFGNLVWDTIDSTWEQLSNANKYYTFDFEPDNPSVGDTFTLTDPVTGTVASHIAVTGDTATTVRDALLSDLTAFRSSFTSPWLFYDITPQTTTTGPVIRIFGDSVERLVTSTTAASSLTDPKFKKEQQTDAKLYTWDSVLRGNFTEIEWTVFKEEDEQPGFYYQIRGDINDYENLPLVLPYIGLYTVEIKLFDLYNNISSKVKLDEICVEGYEVEYSGWYQARKETYTWSVDGTHIWNDYGSYWNLPITPEVNWEEETPSLYESLDRANAILNNFGLGTSPDFQILNFQDDGKASFSGPYTWDNLTEGGWKDTYHLWWDMTSTTGETPSFFEFREVVPNTYLKITDLKGNVALHYFDASTNTLAKAKTQLNSSLDPIVSKYVYNLVLDATSSEVFIQAVSKYFGVYGDFKDVDVVDTTGTSVCRSGGGCDSVITRSADHFSSNPTWNTSKFINDGKVLPMMTWLMFVYDKCKIPGKDSPRWKIRNTTDPTFPDIYFESKYLTYLFKKKGKYEISLELTDSNGNKYKKSRNIIVIK